MPEGRGGINPEKELINHDPALQNTPFIATPAVRLLAKTAHRAVSLRSFLPQRGKKSQCFCRIRLNIRVLKPL